MVEAIRNEEWQGLASGSDKGRAAKSDDKRGQMGHVGEPTQVFNRIKDTGTLVPEQWAKAVVRPIYKSGDRNDWPTYGLISLISAAVGKLFKAAMATRLTSVLYSKEKLFSEDQYRFLPG